MNESPDTTPPTEFLDQYSKDRESGTVRELRAYMEMFPDDPEGVAREYLRCQDGSDTDVTRPPESVADMIGPYRLEEEIGRGGQGIVYRATDTRMGRDVALKVLRHLFGAEQILERFKREAQVAAKTEHPGVCPVYDAGVADGIPYIAMRYVEGRTLARCIVETLHDAGPDFDTSVVQLDTLSDPPESEAEPTPTGSSSRDRSDVMRAVLLVEKTARALHAVHEAGVIHRDVKPGNVMITPSGEAVVMDFGLARDDESDLETLTHSGEVFGTPAYMSPEQLRSEARLDRRTDVWSLGVTLYECVTLARPFKATSREGLYQAILTKEHDPPRRLNPSIPKDLDVVIRAALVKERAGRYQTALDFAEDLRRVREYEPILARPTPPWVRLTRWAQRNPALAATVIGLVVILSVGLATSLFFLGQSLRQEKEKANALTALSNLKSETDAALDAFADALKKEQAQSGLIEQRVAAESAAELQTLQRDKEGLDKELSATKTLLAKLTADLEETSTKLEGMEHDRKTAERRASKLKEDVDRLNELLSASPGTEEVKRLRGQVDELSRQVRQAESTRDEIDRQRSSAVAENGRLLADKARLEERLEQLTGELGRLKAQAAARPTPKPARTASIQIINRYNNPVRVRSVVATRSDGTETQVKIPGSEIISGKEMRLPLPAGTASVKVTYLLYDRNSRRFRRRDIVATAKVTATGGTVELR